MVLQLQKKYDDAEQAAKEAIAMKRIILGANHPHLGRSLGILGWILREQRKFAEAEPLNREEFDIKIATFGYQHRETRMALDALLEVLKGQGKLAEAETFLREQAAQLSRLNEQENPGASNLLKNVEIARADIVRQQARWESDTLNILARQGRFKEAAAETTKVLEIQSSDHFPYHLLAPLLVASGRLGRLSPTL